MANLELEGRIAQKMAVQSGTSARGTWERQDFVLEYQDGSFPSSVCFTAWGQDKVAELSRYQVGDNVKVAFNVRGREYNGKWYNDLRVWRLSAPGQAAPQTAPQEPAYQGPAKPVYSAPAPEMPAYEAPAPEFEDMPAEKDDDLPF